MGKMLDRLHGAHRFPLSCLKKSSFSTGRPGKNFKAQKQTTMRYSSSPMFRIWFFSLSAVSSSIPRTTKFSVW